MGNTYYVAKSGIDSNAGTKESPFLTIQRAADVASAGDTVIVRQGEYREWVRPRQGGLDENSRIVYQAAEGEHVVIKGSERITDWELVERSTWKVVIPNSFFGQENPYALEVMGDWLVDPYEKPAHRGEVYLNGKSFYEAKSLEEVKDPTKRFVSPYETWKGREEHIVESENTIYQWYAEVDEKNTVIYANFQGANPNAELVEINVRSYCFYPEVTGLNYITVRGFEMAQAASPWTPPTAEQPGLLGCHWSKGWIIENNDIHDAKCSGISLGKEISTGDNDHTKRLTKSGYQTQLEVVFKAKHIGWSKETIGSHIVRNNRIHDCGQNGIVGHLGCVFSEIYGNEIYNIATKYEFYGHEIAGIKFHACIDTQIHHNYIHHCSLGIWLDWEIQGTRISSNILHENNRDIMIEVTHGPHVVDNNIFASEFSMVNAAQGGAYIHNLFGGFTQAYPVLQRSTPYHFPHSTDVLGATFVNGGDDRWYQNIFLGGSEENPEFTYGTAYYDGAPTSMGEYVEHLLASAKTIAGIEHSMYLKAKQPVYIARNAYYDGASHYEGEIQYYYTEKTPKLCISEQEGGVYLEMNVEEEMLSINTHIITTDELEKPRVVEQRFENPDGTDIVFNRDVNGLSRGEKPVIGPFANLGAGYNKIKIWDKVV